MLGTEDDQAVINAINERTVAKLVLAGRAEEGTLGGAILVKMQSSESAVVTKYLGPLADAKRTASLMNSIRDQGIPVPTTTSSSRLTTRSTSCKNDCQDHHEPNRRPPSSMRSSNSTIASATSSLIDQISLSCRSA